MPIEKLVYTVPEVASLLGISRPIAYDLANRADFPAIRISQKRIIVPADALRQWLDSKAANHEQA